MHPGGHRLHPRVGGVGRAHGFLFAACVAGCGLLLGRQLELRRPWQKALAAAVVLPLAAVQFIALWEI